MALDDDNRPPKRLCLDLQRSLPLHSKLQSSTDDNIKNASPTSETLFFQPKPDHIARRCTSFLEGFVDPPYPGLKSEYHPVVTAWIRSSATFLAEFTDLPDDSPTKNVQRDSRKFSKGSEQRRKSVRSCTFGSKIPNWDNMPRPSNKMNKRLPTAPVTDKERPPTAEDFKLRRPRLSDYEDHRPAKRSPLASPTFSVDQNQDASDSPPTTISPKPSPQRRPSTVTQAECRSWMAAQNRFIEQDFQSVPAFASNLANNIALRDRTHSRTATELLEDGELHELLIGDKVETDLERYFCQNVFKWQHYLSAIRYYQKAIMAEHSVPRDAHEQKSNPVSTPVPDILYGYKPKQALNATQWRTLREFEGSLSGISGQDDCVLPFLVAEFKSHKGSMCEALNQCMNADHSCLKLIGKLNERLRACGGDDKVIEPVVFSFAINHVGANLHVSWKDETLDHYHTAPFTG